MKQLVSFGTYSNYIVYPLTMMICISLGRFKYDITLNFEYKFLLFESFGLLFLSQLFSGCLYFIQKYNLRNQSNQETQLINGTIIGMESIIDSEPKQKNKYTWKLILFIIALGGINAISTNLISFSNLFLTYLSLELIQTLLPLHFFFYTCLALFILHQPIYRHHYVSLGISLLSFIFIIIPFITNTNTASINWVNLLLFSLGHLLDASLIVSDKWLIMFKRINPYFILFLQGVFGFLLYCVMLIFIFSFCPYNDPAKWYCKDINLFMNIDANTIWFFSISFVELIILNISMFQTINHFSPLHYLFAYVTSSFISWIIDMIQGVKGFNYLTFIGYLLLLIAFLIYNEIIILHCWKLDFNTTKMISNRSDLNFKIDESFELPL